MTTRAQLQSKSIDELREVASAAGIDTDGLQKSKLIAALMDTGEVSESRPAEELDLPRATPRTDPADRPEGADEEQGDDYRDNQSGGGRQRNRRVEVRVMSLSTRRAAHLYARLLERGRER